MIDHTHTSGFLPGLATLASLPPATSSQQSQFKSQTFSQAVGLPPGVYGPPPGTYGEALPPPPGLATASLSQSQTAFHPLQPWNTQTQEHSIHDSYSTQNREQNASMYNIKQKSDFHTREMHQGGFDGQQKTGFFAQGLGQHEQDTDNQFRLRQNQHMLTRQPNISGDRGLSQQHKQERPRMPQQQYRKYGGSKKQGDGW